MWRVTTLLALLLATATGAASGQAQADSGSAARLVPGARVRVHAPSLGEPVSGELAALRHGDLVLSLPPARVVTVSLAEVERLEIARRRNRADLGALIGIVVGGGATFAAFGSQYESNCGSGAFSGICGLGNTFVIAGIVSGAALGGILGSRIGRSREFDEWQPVELGELSLRLAWVGDAPALAFRIGL